MENTEVGVINNYEAQVARMRLKTAKRQAGDNVLFSVSKEPLFLSDGTPADAWAVRRNDTQMPIGIVSENYEIIHTRDIVEASENAFNKYGLNDFTRSMWSNRYGAGNYVQYDFKKVTKEVAKDDIVGLRMTLRNSYDGVSKAVFTLGFLRLVCLNGMTSVNNDVFMTARHTSTGASNFNVLGIVEQMMSQYEENIKMFSNMKEIDITQQAGHNLIDNLWQQNKIVERVAKRVHQVWSRPSYEQDKSRNLWNAYNAFTQTTRDMYDVRPTHRDISMRVTRSVGHELFPLAAPEASYARDHMFSTPLNTCFNN